MDTNADSINGRTLARLDERTEHIQRTVNDIKLMIAALDTRLRYSENEIAQIKGRWSVLVIAISTILSLMINVLIK